MLKILQHAEYGTRDEPDPELSFKNEGNAFKAIRARILGEDRNSATSSTEAKSKDGAAKTSSTEESFGSGNTPGRATAATGWTDLEAGEGG